MQGLLAAARGRAGRRQPEPRLRREGARDRAGDLRGGPQGHARRRRVGQRRRAAAARSAIPPAYPHVLDGRRDRPRERGRRASRAARDYVDLAAPGVDIPIATRPRQGLARRRRHELLGAARLGRERMGLDGATRARRNAAVRGDAPLGRRHRRAGRDDAAGLRPAQRPCRARATPRRSAIRSSRTTTSSSSTRTGSTTRSIPPLTTPTQAVGDRRRRGSTASRTRATSTASGCPRDGARHRDPDGRRERRPRPLEAGHREHPRAVRRHRPAGARRRSRERRAARCSRTRGTGRFAYLAVYPRAGVHEATYTPAGRSRRQRLTSRRRSTHDGGVLDGRVEDDVGLPHAHAHAR